MSTEEYLKALAYELRKRKNSETMVRETLQEVAGHLAESGESGETAFGEPKEYAASFPLGSSTSRGKHVGNLGGIVVIVTLGAFLVLRGTFDVDFGVSGTLAYFAVVLALAAAIIVASERIDRRLPDLR